MLILYPTVLLILVIWLYAEIDPWFKELIILLLLGIRHEFIKIPFRIKLEWDVFWMKRNMKRHIKMAKKILKEIEDEAN